MTSGPSPPSDNEGRVVRFKRNPGGINQSIPEAPVDDLKKFERGPETDDYRHRMIVNVVTFLFVAALIGAGLWLADTMASLRRNQDCALAGHRNCLRIEDIR